MEEPVVRKRGLEFLASFARLLGTIALLLAFRWLIFEPYVIPSGSMIPSLLIHDHIVVQKWVYGLRVPFTDRWLWRWSQPEAGDVVVFRSVESDDYFMIKRVVAVAGDRLSWSESGQLVVNGQPVERTPVEFASAGSALPGVIESDLGASLSRVQFFEERFRSDESHWVMEYRDQMGALETEYIVPADHVFVLGDNRDQSRDSRYWGPLPLSHLLGRASRIWLSCRETLQAAPFVCNPTTLRWSRLFAPIQ